MNPNKPLPQLSDEQVVRRKWPSAHILPSLPPNAGLYAVFTGIANLKGGNGKHRNSKWRETESEAWSDARSKLKTNESSVAPEGEEK